MKRTLQYLDVPFVGDEYLESDGSLVKGVSPEEMKADVDDAGRIKGWGAIFNTPDAGRDIIMPGAFTNSLKQGGHNRMGVAMLYIHDTRRPLGMWDVMEEKKKGLWCEGMLALGTRDGNDAHVFMKMGALRGLSIGYNTLIEEEDKVKKCRRLKEIDLWEVSPVVFPMHLGAQIVGVKALESELIWQLKDFIEENNTERGLERALREAGVSKQAALFMVKLARPILRESREAGERLAEQDEAAVRELLAELQGLTNSLK